MINGHVYPSWDIDYIKSINYTLYDYNDHSRDLKAFNGLYDEKDFTRYTNMKLNQSLDHENDKNLEFLDTEFSWLKNKKVQINRLDPGAILPKHYDTYQYYNDLYNIQDNTKIFRILLTLENWQSGQYIEIKNKGYVNWVAGDWFGFNLSDYHLVANLGHVDRYALIMTGTLE